MGSRSSRPTGKLFVLSGPSGVGKDAALSRLKELGRPYHFTVTATTRKIRPGEQDGVDYIFLNRREFEEMIEREDLLEWAEVYGNLYGVPKSQVVEARDQGRDVIIKIDVQGAATVKKLFPDAVLIFLEPPDMSSLEQRLRLRNTEDEAAFELKLKTAYSEMNEAEWFNYRVVNDDDRLDEAVATIDDVLRRELCR